jgi:hypothetical protein
MAAAIWWLPVFLGALDEEEASVHELLLLALLRDCRLDGGHLITQGDQRTHHVFDRMESPDDVRHGELLLSLLGCCPCTISYR